MGRRYFFPGVGLNTGTLYYTSLRGSGVGFPLAGGLLAEGPLLEGASGPGWCPGLSAGPTSFLVGFFWTRYNLIKDSTSKYPLLGLASFQLVHAALQGI
jgi:hypothetical protein